MVGIFKLEVIKKLIPDKVKEMIIEKIHGKHFVFDKESYEEYKKFKDDDYFITFLENGYLCRYPKWDREKVSPKNFQFFHIWLMNDELEKFKEYHEGPIHIHHLTWCKRINIKKYLLITLKKVHTNIHEYSLYDIKYMEKSKWIEFED